LADELVEAQENDSLSRLWRQLFKVDLLILDDLSYLSFFQAAVGTAVSDDI